MKSVDGCVRAVVLACFWCSGMAGLVYQVVWARYLALFLGHTSYAVVAVLVAFMGGLAIGNAWIGRRADASLRPLRLYAGLEIGIGLYALAFPVVYSLAHHGFVTLARHFVPGGGAALALKIVFSFLTILPPAVLMGATLPVLTRFTTRSLGEVRQRVSALYAINSAGAVAGCLAADFWWIPAFGLPATVAIGAVLNLAVGVVTWWLGAQIPEVSAGETKPHRSDDFPVGDTVAATASPEEILTRPELKLAVFGIALSGFVAMLYEVAWTRLLALALGSSTHAFSLMVATMITGITVGAWLVGRWKTVRRPLVVFAGAEIALAFTLLGSLFLYERLPLWFAQLAALLARRDEAYPVYALLQALICFAVMFAPTVCLGVTLPLVSRMATQELARTGRSVGMVFALNTLGAVLGAAVTGLWLLPALGLARTFALGIAVNLLIGLMILGRKLRGAGWKLAVVTPLVLGGLLWFAHGQFDARWQHAFTSGLWRNHRGLTSFAEFRASSTNTVMKFYADGAGSTVAVTDVAGETATNAVRLLKVNGKADASTGSDMLTQLLSAHIPLLLRPEAGDVLVIGLGSGMTGGAVLCHPGVRRLDIVEISPEVAQAARFFSDYNGRVLDDPRTHLVVEDAKTFLKTTGQAYHAIISEPSNPWMAGVAGVFTREFFENCRQRLRPGGVMVQWLQLYESNDRVFDLVLNTFTSVFPHLSVWRGANGDLLLVGSPQPLTVDLPALVQAFKEPAVQADLKRLDIMRVPVLLSQELISAENAPFLAPAGPVHGDLHPRLEYLAERAFFVNDRAEKWRELDESLSARPGTLLGEYLQQHPLAEADLVAFARFQNAQLGLRPELFQSLLSRWKHNFPASLRAHTVGIQAWDDGSLAELAVRQLAPVREAMVREAARDPELLHFYARFLLQAYREHRSVFYLPEAAELKSVLRRLLEMNPRDQRVYRLHLAELAWDRGDDAECLRLGAAALDPDVATAGPLNFTRDPKAPGIVLGHMLDVFSRSNQMTEAAALLSQAQRIGAVGQKSSGLDDSPVLALRKFARQHPH